LIGGEGSVRLRRWRASGVRRILPSVLKEFFRSEMEDVVCK
jgi:hypothetical protein